MVNGLAHSDNLPSFILSISLRPTTTTTCTLSQDTRARLQHTRARLAAPRDPRVPTLPIRATTIQHPIHRHDHDHDRAPPQPRQQNESSQEPRQAQAMDQREARLRLEDRLYAGFPRLGKAGRGAPRSHGENGHDCRTICGHARAESHWRDCRDRVGRRGRRGQADSAGRARRIDAALGHDARRRVDVWPRFGRHGRGVG
ncbi:hypothetical protein AMAG_10699 [Allomyces macrogynus ATCC 38327]|uniref:Uncharacterized protein n=1 Tax=Allomyces macrogynus (strain ATCC 38327) TaxID=578462 RepID=A0A0L0SR91_ALLM3|nr:hypothetical protein AMAG_10699 [Allomyces macrogynus ATCC 38327]|eukprot:KNE65032.1 hypothetical protein AMAG_10699 [Allomyces macrogynus ATCC 38327]